MNPPENPINTSSNEEDAHSQYAMQIANASVLPMVLRSCIELDVLEIIHRTGIEYVAGDMFISIPKGDAIFLKWMLHSWDDEHCMKILKNCYDALPDQGKVMVVELVVPECPESRVEVRSKLQFELIMMNMNPGGKERTEIEFKTLAEAAGFSSTKLECSAYNFSLMELYK